MKRIICMFFAVGVALGGLAARAADPIEIKFSHVVAPGTPKGKAALRFKELAEQRTRGRVRVDVYANSELYKDKDELDALQTGAVHIIAPSLAKFSPLGITEFEVFDLPYIFPGVDLLRRVTEGAIGRDLLKKLEPKGIVGLGYWHNGFKVMSANRPLRQPADFKDLKMRIQASKVIDSQMRALGASPQPMAFSEVYKALESGVVDGTENPPSNLYTQKMHQVQKHITVSNHAYLGYAVIVNKKFWDDLPNDIRVQLKLAMADATGYANQVAEHENLDALAKVKAAGTSQVHELSITERDLWRQTLAPVHKQMEERVGKELIQSIYKEGEALGYKFKF